MHVRLPRHASRGFQGVETPVIVKSSCFGENTTSKLNCRSGTGRSARRRRGVGEYHIAVRTFACLDREVGGDSADESVDVALVEDSADPQARGVVIRDDDV